MAKKLPEENKDEQEKEYLAIFAIFTKLLGSISKDTDQWEVLEELMALRADFAIHHAIKGFGMDYEKALELVRNYSGNLSNEDKERKTILVAAIDNLVDFAVCEEYQMAQELPDFDEDDLDEVLQDELDGIFHKYNFRYANVENQDIEYAMIVAAGLLGISSNTELTFTTMGDERVRPWHLQYEGFSAPKHSFPAWLVPPIEHRCRCYLEEGNIFGALQQVSAKKMPEMPEWFNPTFKESVAFGGRIFSDEHNYFKCDAQHKERLGKISQRIKSKYL